jgi:hypothetical protein
LIDEDVDDDDDGPFSSQVNIDTGDVTAKIINGPMYIKIYDADGFAIDAAPEVEDDDPDDDDYAVEDDDDDLDLDLSNGTGGFTFGYEADAFDVAVHFATQSSFGGGDDENNGHILIGADAGFMAGPADIGVEVARGIGFDEILGLGATVDLAIDPLDVGLGFDGQLPDGGDFAWEVGAYIDAVVGPATVALDVIYGELADLDLELDVDLAIAPIDLGIFVGGYETFEDYRIFVDASFAATDQITVSAEGGYNSLEEVPINIAAEMALIPNTTFTLEYDTDDVQVDNGAVSFEVEISY